MSLGRGLRVLDAMCGCGVRSLRYLSQAGAAFVWANDAFEGYRSLILSNLSGEARVSPEGDRRWVVTHLVANKVLAESYLQRDFFDLVDIDSFGSDSSFMSLAIAAVKIGGLLYITSTDGYSSGGHRPHQVMLRVARGKLHENSQYSFLSYCNRCGNSQTFPWEELGRISCPCTNGGVSRSVVVSGPLWTGPLHDAAYLTEMLKLAREWGWASTKQNDVDLEKLLNQMIDESNPQLPPGYIKLDEIARRAKINSPPISSLISTLEKEGFAACRSHIAPNAVKTNCPMAACVRIARELRHIASKYVCMFKNGRSGKLSRELQFCCNMPNRGHNPDLKMRFIPFQCRSYAAMMWTLDSGLIWLDGLLILGMTIKESPFRILYNGG
ncbi:putative tRNA (guanine(26)-N(2))-dimethyltransferase [Cocos nucifera]|uniref:Putative tRNA (Guanine(26)-N(2))-dimethyltransferase n=1 Tax=Cocos nucifera TaxID=13894 RepID=A0A8K0NG15_COCNU|nr:putative tRNA (guanine(26)-N(2))-dimethyltransferase [Cocos nucifera]